MIQKRSIFWVTVMLSLPVVWLSQAKASISESEARLWVVVNEGNPVRTLDINELRAIYTATQRHWSNRSPVVPLNSLPRSLPRVTFDRAVLHMGPDEASRFWINQKVRGGSSPPRKVPSSRLAAAMVRKLNGGVAYIEVSKCVPKGTKVVAVVDKGTVHHPQLEKIFPCNN